MLFLKCFLEKKMRNDNNPFLKCFLEKKNENLEASTKMVQRQIEASDSLLLLLLLPLLSLLQDIGHGVGHVLGQPVEQPARLPLSRSDHL